MKLTVSEYAKRLNVSVQTVYKKIKRGVIATVKENNITYVVLNDKEGVTEAKQKVSESSNELLTLVKAQQKEIKRLTKKLEKANSSKEDVFLKYIAELKEVKLLKTPAEFQELEEDALEAEIKPKKKKKNKNKKGKKK